MKKSFLIIFGILIIITGFFYDVLFAGIPPQDAPIEIANNYMFHKNISEYIMQIGLGITLIGLVIRFITSKKSN